MSGSSVAFLNSINGYLNKNFSMKDLGEAAYILGIKILIGISQRTYLDKVLKKFKIDQAKKGFLHVLQGVKLSKTQNPTMAENRKKMKSHSLCLRHRFYKVCYAMTRPIVYLALSLARKYKFDIGVDHWTLVKNILSKD